MALRRGKPLNRRSRLRSKQGTCCGKKRFATREAAEAALYRIAMVSARDYRLRSAYECKNGWWHLTKQASTIGPAPSARELVLERDQYRCGRCGASIFGGPWSVQHRRAKGSGGTSDPARNLPSNLILLCGSATSPGGCHLFCEQRNADAEADGFVVSLNSRVDPATVPVRHALYGLVYLTDEGSVLPAGEPAVRLHADLKTAAAADTATADETTPNPLEED